MEKKRSSNYNIDLFQLVPVLYTPHTTGAEIMLVKDEGSIRRRWTEFMSLTIFKEHPALGKKP